MIWLLLIIPAFWLYAEFKLGRTARLVSGIISIAVVAVLIDSAFQYRRSYEKIWHRRSMHLAAELLSKGETNKLQRAFEAYNTTVRTGSTEQASSDMLVILASPK